MNQAHWHLNKVEYEKKVWKFLYEMLCGMMRYVMETVENIRIEISGYNWCETYINGRIVIVKLCTIQPINV